MVAYSSVEQRRNGRLIADLSTHQLLGLIDFQLRNLVYLGLCANNDAGGGEILLHRTPGLGTWLAALRELEARQSIELRFPELADAIVRVRASISAATPGAVHGLGTIKRYRDFLAHGGTEPSAADSSEDRAAITEVAEGISTTLGHLLSACYVRDGAAANEPKRVIASFPAGPIDLWPLIVADRRSDWLVLGQVIDDAAWYDAPGSSPLRVLLRADDLRRDLRRFLRPISRDQVQSDFIGAVKHDLGAFSPLNSDVLHATEGRDFTVEWVQAVSSGDIVREDRFRVGPDDARQWFDPEESAWVSYRSFLRRVANWPVLRERLRDVAKISESRDQLLSDLPDAKFVQPRFAQTDFFDQASPEVGTSVPMAQVIEELLSARGRSTEIVFVQGPAGIGKTRALRSLAIERMSSSVDDDAPLYLYVEAGSVSLSDLSSLVDAAISSTRILVADSVRALARNGLLVLIIDGFDELLGGLSYKEPLETLRPWLDALGGRGVLLVSARSSYFFNHYRSSLRRVGQDLSISHRVFRLEEWNDAQLSDFMSSAGVPFDVLDRLDVDDRALVRLPFFAGVLASANLKGDGAAAPARIADILIDRYIEREASKLAADGHGSPSMMTTGELKNFFVSLSELMSDEGVSESDIRLAAEVAVSGISVDDRDGLTDRLTSLCALGYDTAGKGSFRFEHEIYFDYFYSHVLIAQMERVRSQTDLGPLGRVTIRGWTASLVVSAIPAECALTLDSTFSSRSPEHPIRRANCGLLYAALAESSPGLLPNRVRSAIIDTFTVPRSVRHLDLVDVEIDELNIRDFNGGTMTFRNSYVRRMLASRGSISTIEIDYAALPEELIEPERMLASRAQIARAISDSGGVVHDFSIENSIAPGLVTDGVEFLERLGAGSIVRPVIDASTKLPNDQRMRWAIAKEGSWRIFVQELERAGLVELVPIAAAGPARMARLTFRSSPTTIIDAKEAPAVAFWQALQGHSI